MSSTTVSEATFMGLSYEIRLLIYKELCDAHGSSNLIPQDIAPFLAVSVQTRSECLHFWDRKTSVHVRFNKPENVTDFLKWAQTPALPRIPLTELKISACVCVYNINDEFAYSWITHRFYVTQNMEKERIIDWYMPELAKESKVSVYKTNAIKSKTSKSGSKLVPSSFYSLEKLLGPYYNIVSMGVQSEQPRPYFEPQELVKIAEQVAASTDFSSIKSSALTRPEKPASTRRPFRFAVNRSTPPDTRNTSWGHWKGSFGFRAEHGRLL